MASANINVRVKGELQAHLQLQIGEHGLYENASEYIRALIRRDLKSRRESWTPPAADQRRRLLAVLNCGKPSAQEPQ